VCCKDSAATGFKTALSEDMLSKTGSVLPDINLSLVYKVRNVEA
jgi:hypothetical protein